MLDQQINYSKNQRRITSLTNAKRRSVLFLVLVCISGILFVSCNKNDIETINLYKKEKKLPDISVKEAEIVFTDSGKTKVKVKAPELHKYKLENEPYTEFPEGLNVYFYNFRQNVKSTIKANYAIYYEDKNLWEAKDDVRAVNQKGEKLNTEHLYWDQKKEKIYSNKFTRITSGEEVFSGKNGFVSNQDFTKWRLKKSKGTVKIEDDNE